MKLWWAGFCVFYAEAHHLKPLGGEHRGPDIEGNLICLCPNHHALFDYFAVRLDVGKLAFCEHTLGAEFVDYHNARVSKGATSKVVKHCSPR